MADLIMVLVNLWRLFINMTQIDGKITLFIYIHVYKNIILLSINMMVVSMDF